MPLFRLFMLFIFWHYFIFMCHIIFLVVEWLFLGEYRDLLTVPQMTGNHSFSTKNTPYTVNSGYTRFRTDSGFKKYHFGKLVQCSTLKCGNLLVSLEVTHPNDENTSVERIKIMKKQINKKEAEIMLKNLGREMFDQMFEIYSYADKVIDSIEDNDNYFSIKTFNDEGSYNCNQKLNCIFKTFFGVWNNEKNSWIIPTIYKDIVVDLIRKHSIKWAI